MFTLSALRCAPDHKPDSETPQNDIQIHENLLQFNQASAKQDLDALTASSHSLGSERQIEVRDYLIKRLKDAGIIPLSQPFKAETPNPVLLSNPSSPAPLTIIKDGTNILAVAHAGSSNCIVLLASHYDTKHLENGDYLGANDSGSSTLGLMQILISLKKPSTKLPATNCSLGGYFFDGEEPVLPEWNDGINKHPAKIRDHLYGSRFAAEALVKCGDKLCLPKDLGGQELKALILLDMIGSPEVQLTMDQNSDPDLKKSAIALNKSLFTTSIIHPMMTPGIQDDHIPFIEKGIAAIDLIDFYHLDHWHKVSDKADTISMASIEKVSTLAANLALLVAR